MLVRLFNTVYVQVEKVDALYDLLVSVTLLTLTLVEVSC